MYALYRTAFNDLYNYAPRRPPASFYEFLDEHDYDHLDDWPLPGADPEAAETVGDFAMADLVQTYLPEGFVDVPLDGPYWAIVAVSPLTSDGADVSDAASDASGGVYPDPD